MLCRALLQFSFKLNTYLNAVIRHSLMCIIMKHQFIKRLAELHNLLTTSFKSRFRIFEWEALITEFADLQSIVCNFVKFHKLSCWRE